MLVSRAIFCLNKITPEGLRWGRLGSVLLSLSLLPALARLFLGSVASGAESPVAVSKLLTLMDSLSGTSAINQRDALGENGQVRSYLTIKVVAFGPEPARDRQKLFLEEDVGQLV